MNWETYKTLNEQQKEEYNFRFKEDIQFSTVTLTLAVTSLFSFVVVLLFVSYLITTMPALSEYVVDIQTYIHQAGVLILSVLILIIGFTIEYIARIFIRFIKYNKWLKDNNITVINWWTKWRK